ncbi:MAG: hypothetical protein ACR2GM_06545 [Nocardioidaceae bacterium]
MRIATYRDVVRTIPDPGFARDDGAPAPSLVAALSAYPPRRSSGAGGRSPGSLAAVDPRGRPARGPRSDRPGAGHRQASQPGRRPADRAAGPVRLVVEGEDLRRLAVGERLLPVGEEWVWATDVQAASPGW